MRINRKRKGIATTELALCMPILISITLAVIETTTIFHLKEAATLAAYEGARVGIRKQGTDDLAETKIKSFLDDRGIAYNDAEVVTISSPGFDSADAMEHVSVVVTIPCEGNTVTNWLFSSREVNASVTMRKEFKNL